MITTERLAEIEAATKTNPVRLTDEEVAEMHLRNKNRFQMDIGAGIFLLPATEGSDAASAHQLKAEKKTDAEIAEALGLEESKVRRILAGTYTT